MKIIVVLFNGLLKTIKESAPVIAFSLVMLLNIVMQRLATNIVVMSLLIVISMFVASKKGNIITNIAKELVSLFIIIVTIYIFWQFLRGIRQNYVIIEPFEVAEPLKNAGYSGKAVATRIMHNIDVISDNSGFTFRNVVINTGSITTPEIILPGSSNTLRAFVVNFRETINRPVPTITGDIIQKKDNLEVYVKVTGSQKYRGASKVVQNSQADVDKALYDAAESVLLQMQPLVLAGHLYNKGQFNSAVEICKNIKVEENIADVTYLVWANSHFMLRQYPEALKVIELASKAKNNNDSQAFIYSVWGATLRKLGKYPEAIEKYKVVTTYDPNYFYTYCMIADLFILQGNYNQAKTYLERAISLTVTHKEMEKISSVLIQLHADLIRLKPKELDQMKGKMNKKIMTLCSC